MSLGSFSLPYGRNHFHILFRSFRGPKGPAYGGERGTEEGMIGSERNWHAIPRVKRRQEREPDGRAVTVTGVGSGGQGVSDTQSERYGWRNEVTNGSEPRVTKPYGRRREWRIEPRLLPSASRLLSLPPVPLLACLGSTRSLGSFPRSSLIPRGAVVRWNRTASAGGREPRERRLGAGPGPCHSHPHSVRPFLTVTTVPS